MSPWSWKHHWTCVTKGTTARIFYSVYCSGRVSFTGREHVLLESSFTIYNFLRGFSPRSSLFNMCFKYFPIKVASSGVMGNSIVWTRVVEVPYWGYMMISSSSKLVSICGPFSFASMSC